jgi:hypothetical protein
MWTKKVSRSELAEILNSGRLSSHVGLYESEASLIALGGRNEIELLWSDDPRRDSRFPAAMIVDREEQRDLLAWLNTYSRSIRPVTAYCRISDRQTAAETLAIKNSPRLGRLEDACLGLIVGETATYLPSKKDLRSVTHTACLSTMSFSVARAAGFGFDKRIISEVQTRWAQSRTLIGSSPLPINGASLLAAWSVIRHLSKGEFNLPLDEPVSPLILDACTQIVSNGVIGESEWRALTKDLAGLAPLQEELKGPREERLLLFERAANDARQSRTYKSGSAEFLCAYLASSISPGTLDHLHVLQPYLYTFPTLLIWYGLCAGLSSRDTLGATLNGLVRRVKRELVREEHFLQAPACDIGFAELALMSSSTREWSELRTNNPGQIVVELFPCINSHYRSPRSDNTLEGPSAEVGPALNELANLLDRTSESISRFRRAAGIIEPRTSEPDKEKKRGKKGTA